MACRKANLTINEDLLSRADAYAKANGMTRSGLVTVALAQYLNAVEMAPAAKEVLVNLANLMQKASGNAMSEDELSEQINDIELAQKRLLGK